MGLYESLELKLSVGFRFLIILSWLFNILVFSTVAKSDSINGRVVLEISEILSLLKSSGNLNGSLFMDCEGKITSP